MELEGTLFLDVMCPVEEVKRRVTRLESNNMMREALMPLLNRQTKPCCPN